MSEMTLSPAQASAHCSAPAFTAQSDFLVSALALRWDSWGPGIINLPILLTDLSHSCILAFLLRHENHNCTFCLGKR